MIPLRKIDRTEIRDGVLYEILECDHTMVIGAAYDTRTTSMFDKRPAKARRCCYCALEATPGGTA